MKPTKEQIIEWASEAGFMYCKDYSEGWLVTMERFANIAYAKGQEDMRERCASLAETTPKVWDCGAPPPQQRIATAIRALSIQKGGED